MSHTVRASAAGLRAGRAILPPNRPTSRTLAFVRRGGAPEGSLLVESLRGGPLTPGVANAYLSTVSTRAAETINAAPTTEIKSMSGAEIRETFLKFFEDKGHTRLPSSSLVPEDPTVLLTIAGMLQFKPIFMGQQARTVPCATTTQKCIRTNDIENVGVTARHHTFFEMLGNFSFGDYFKREAIKYAWELSTKVFGLPEHQVWVSVFEDDDEAYAIWRDEVGVDERRIMRMGAKDNFWAAGATGPCGPCSELYFDFHPERGHDGADLEDDDRFIEFYNLVFMELSRDANGDLTPLANKNIDTGMGLERMAQILQGVPNNYETDLIAPIIDQAASLAGITYSQSSEATKTDLKVIGDHVRAVVYMISDGIVPSNVGRGYVVRRLLRRVVMKGRLLGISGPFVAPVAEVAIGMSSACDPTVEKNTKRILDEMSREEARFSATLDKGQELLSGMLEEAKESKVLKGADAFMLYDTFGFPLEITQELAEVEDMTVDTEGFNACMSEQRKRSQAAHEGVDLTADAELSAMAADGSLADTDFVGYNATSSSGCTVLAMLLNGELVSTASAGSKVELVLDRTPFYAESGGQVGDNGMLKVVSDGDEPSVLLVSDVQKRGGGSVFVHACDLEAGAVSVGDTVEAIINTDLRRRIMANHTATHLLQSALKIVLGEDTAQQGSLVTGERLRFDFNLPRAMEAEEISEVERLINGWVADAHALEVATMPIAEAKEAGATMMFGEKYGSTVRVVDVPGVSMELCGGTHVANTSQVGAFKVLSESGIASGIRRVEALAGPAAVDYLNMVDSLARTVSSSLNAKFDDVPSRLTSLQDEVKSLNKALAAAKAELALAKSAALVSEAVDAPATGAKVLVAQLDGADASSLSEAASSMQASLGDNAAVLLGSSVDGGKVALVAAFGPDVVKNGPKGGAGKFVGSIAKMCGGGGGGRPNLAQAGGKDASKLPEALDAAKTALLEAL